MTGGSKPFARFTKSIVLGGLLLALAVSLLLWYTTTHRFQRWVRFRLVAAIEDATGGHAELGRFHLIPFRFAVEIENLTIHGREPVEDVPLVHVDRVRATVNLPPIFGTNIGFQSLTLEHPVVHLIFYPDGSTNRPSPQPPTGANFEHLFSVSMDKLLVKRGELLWQDRRIPLDFTLNEVSAALDYSFLHRRYLGRISVGNGETHLAGERRFAWAAQSAFTIGAGSVEFERLQLSSEDSRLEARGTLVNFNHPLLKADYNLRLNLPEAGRIARRPQLRSGSLELQGSGSWAADRFLLSGKFFTQSLGWRDRQLNLSTASAEGKYTVDPASFTLSQVQGTLLGGSFTSDAEISGWQSFMGTRNLSSPGQTGSIKVRWKDISLTEVAASLGLEFRRLSSLRFAGRVAGTSDLHWKDTPRDGELGLALNVSPPSYSSPNQIPLQAVADGTYSLNRGAVSIRELFVSTPATNLRAAGTLSPTGVVRVSFVNTDFGELRPVVAPLFPSAMPLAVNGHTAFHGEVAGGLADPFISGNLELEDLDARGIPGKTWPVGVVHCDLLRSDIQLSAHGISMRNALVKSAVATLRFDGNAQLVAWKLLPLNPIHLTAKLDQGDAAQLARIFPNPLEMAGRLRANFELGGSTSLVAGQGTVALSRGSIANYAVDSARTTVALKGGDVWLKSFAATRAASQISGSGHYDLATRNFDIQVVGKDFDLAAMPRPALSPAIGGRLDFSAQGSGSLAEPNIRAHLGFENLTFNQEMLGNYALDAVTHGAELRLTGHSNFENAELVLDGNVHLRGRWPAAIDFHFNRLDVDSFLARSMRAYISGHSRVAGDLRLEGPLLDPGRWTWAGNLTDFNANVAKIKLRNQDPVRFALAGQTLKISAFHMVGDNTDFAASGSIELANQGELNLEATGKIALGLIATYDSDLTASGTAAGEARITGTRQAPILQGKLQVNNGSIADINMPTALSDMNGTLHFTQNQITIESLQARTGGGTVGFTGHSELVGRQINFDLTAHVDTVRLRYPPGVSSTADAVLHWTGSSTGSQLSGDITVRRLGVTPGFDFGAYLERSTLQSSLPQTDPILNKIRLDLHVTTAPELQMQTSVLRLRGEADLRVRGNAAKPVILGRADVFEGDAYFNGTKYRLQRGGVSFTNAAITTPFLDLEATTHVRDYDITVSLNGDLSRPNGLKMSYRSEPPLPTADIISLLAFGQTTETSAQLQQGSQSAFSQQASNAMLAAALNATLNNRAQRLFGNSRIKIDPQGLETETSPTQSGPAVTIEQQVKDNLTLSYTTSVSQTSQQIIRAEYNVTRNLSIVGIRDQNGVVSFEVKLRRRKR